MSTEKGPLVDYCPGERLYGSWPKIVGRITARMLVATNDAVTRHGKTLMMVLFSGRSGGECLKTMCSWGLSSTHVRTSLCCKCQANDINLMLVRRSICFTADSAQAALLLRNLN